jgi:predicted DNA-binding transcriptional regulator YafY
MPASSRVLSLLHLLQGREWATGPELAEQLEIDLRMLRRDVVRLQDLGIPVESRLGRHGGYRLRPGYRLPPLMLTDDEATAVTLALRAAQRSGSGISAPAIEAALAKIRRVLPSRLSADIEHLETSLAFAGAGPERETVAAATLLSLARAMTAQRRIRIGYSARDRAATTRDIDPYGLVVIRGRWYLAALDHAKQDLRTFRVDRITGVEQLGLPALVPVGFDATAFVEQTLARIPWGWEIQVVAAASPADVRTTLPRTVAELTEEGSSTIVRFQAADLGGAARMLSAMPWSFEVRAPAELADAIEGHAQRLLETARRAR